MFSFAYFCSTIHIDTEFTRVRFTNRYLSSLAAYVQCVVSGIIITVAWITYICGMLYWPVLLNIVMLCMAACMFKRWCYIKLLGNMSPTCQHICTHITSTHTCLYTQMHTRTQSRHICNTVILYITMHSGAKSMLLYKVRKASVSCQWCTVLCLLWVFSI